MGDGGLVDSNTFLTSTGSVVGSGNNSFVDGFMVDHLPLQLITSTTPKVNLDIEIDIQLLTSDYDGGTTVSRCLYIYTEGMGGMRGGGGATQEVGGNHHRK